MKATEVMIGDIVTYECRLAKVINIANRNYKEAPTNISIQDYNGNVQHPCWDELVEPVPITERFLKKNFEKKTFYGIYDDYFDFSIHAFNDGMYIVNYHCCEMNLPDESITVCFIHQLQHFMNHCGINKELAV
jgi:hypothetical protein